MNKISKVVITITALCILMCSLPATALASTNGGSDVEPTYTTYPDPDLGGGYRREDIFTMNATNVTSFLRSNGTYTGRTKLDGTYRFGYKFKLTHSLAGTTHNYAMRGGICYYNSSTQMYDPLSCIDSTTSGKTHTGYIAKDRFVQDRIYYGYVKNKLGSGSVTGTLTFFRVLNP